MTKALMIFSAILLFGAGMGVGAFGGAHFASEGKVARSELNRAIHAVNLSASASILSDIATAFEPGKDTRCRAAEVAARIAINLPLHAKIVSKHYPKGPNDDLWTPSAQEGIAAIYHVEAALTMYRKYSVNEIYGECKFGAGDWVIRQNKHIDQWLENENPRK